MNFIQVWNQRGDFISPRWYIAIIRYSTISLIEIDLIVVPPTMAEITFNRGTFGVDSDVACDAID